MSTIQTWSTTAASNTSIDSIDIAENCSPANLNNAARASMANIAALRDLNGGAAVSGGAADVQTLTTGLGLSAYQQGLLMGFEAGYTNTGATTMNVDGLGAKSVKTPAGAALTAGMITAGGIYLMAYEATAGVLILLNATASAASVTRGTLGLDTTDSPQFAGINLGHASDTTLTRNSAGNVSIEGNIIYRAGGTNVAVADGGTGADTAAAGFDALAPTTTRGDIIFRNASTNTRLAKGTSGQVLTMGANDPAWATAPGWTLIASGSLPAANLLEFTSITARLLLLKVTGASCATASRLLRLQFSIDNGSSYLSSAVGFYISAGTVGDLPAASNVFPATTTEAAASTVSAYVQITTQGGLASGWFNSATDTNRVFQAECGSTSAVNAIRLIWNSTGDFDAGTYELYGI